MEKVLDISDLFHTNMFQNKKTLQVSKMLHTLKDEMAFIEENVDLVIDSRGGGSLNNAFKRRKRKKSRKS